MQQFPRGTPHNPPSYRMPQPSVSHPRYVGSSYLQGSVPQMQQLQSIQYQQLPPQQHVATYSQTPQIQQQQMPQYSQQQQTPFGQQNVPFYQSMAGYQFSQQQQNYMCPSQVAYQTPLYQPETPSLEPFLVNIEWEEMKEALKILQDSSFEKFFKFDELFPYLFDKSITSMPFPKHFEIVKFTKYQGKGDPRHHIK